MVEAATTFIFNVTEITTDAGGMLVMVCYSGDMNRSEPLFEPLRKFGPFKGRLARMPLRRITNAAIARPHR